MRNIEYTKMACLYDKFYSKKEYEKEVKFIEHFISNKNVKILDAGCGSGTHAKILFDKGYNVFGFDKSAQMVEIANGKIKDRFFVDDLLYLQKQEKYDLILSFFAVFNHLKNYREFEVALFNLKSLLKESGKIIIDLHNPQKSGKKQETIDGAARIMKWRRCGVLKKEFTIIKYIVGGQVYKTRHTFKIFNISKLQKIAEELGFNNIEFCENYMPRTIASGKSKNIQMIVSL